MAKNKKVVAIALTDEMHEKGKQLSKNLLGTENLSGYISYLINKEDKKLQKQ